MSQQQIDYLQSLYDSRDEALAQLTNALQSPKPSYSIDGQSIQWQPYVDWLSKLIETLDDQIRKNQGPYMARSVGRG